MPSATLLLREPSTTSLTLIVEKSQHKKPPYAEYELRLNLYQLDFVLLTSPETHRKLSATDEGFESDIDTVSIVSSDDSFTGTNAKLQETDSANGSASSDSDTETIITKPPIQNNRSESYNLVNCMCYTDIKFPNILVFVVKCDALVFRFDNLSILKNFYTSFTTFKAIANQKVYQNVAGTKFNLLQRTDRNGITHIEITKEVNFPKCENSQIISLNTPDFKDPEENSATSNIHKESSRSNFRNANLRQRSESPNLEYQSKKECNENSHNPKGGLSPSERASSIENILNAQSLSNLKKVWKSAEDLLEAPKRPERRRKKQRAPDPPTNPPKPEENVLAGQYVRVNVVQETNRFQLKKYLPQIYCTLNPKKEIFQQFKYIESKRAENWTYSVPRFLRRPRSQSETRNLHLDFTQNEEKNGVANRLFGMSSKLKEFHSNTVGRRYDWDKYEPRRGSLGELTYTLDNGGGSLKSVIKKDNNKRKNDKKVTFSAYTTVQVV
ncbi:hypothetical protein FQA39_LY18898 [Lamprigera yunnana]|nr:hypothetical protein FQA39_LY18898 [Lamprigera yunnana]